MSSVTRNFSTKELCIFELKCFEGEECKIQGFQYTQYDDKKYSKDVENGDCKIYNLLVIVELPFRGIKQCHLGIFLWLISSFSTIAFCRFGFRTSAALKKSQENLNSEGSSSGFCAV